MGSGDPIIFIHRWGSDGYSLHSLAALAARTHTVFTIDLPGFGKSENPPHHWGLEGYSFVIKEFIAKKHLKCVTLVGHGIGSAIAITLISQSPQLIAKFILISCPINRNTYISPAAKMMRKIPRNNPMLKLIYPPAMRLYYHMFHNASELHVNPALEANFRKIILQDVKQKLKRCMIPTLIVWGENDTVTPVIHAHEIHQLISHSQIAIIPKGLHDVPMENPSEVWGKISSFLVP
jgi:pimeloyl-ACP methyl ester carboxylesterase